MSHPGRAVRVHTMSWPFFHSVNLTCVLHVKRNQDPHVALEGRDVMDGSHSAPPNYTLRHPKLNMIETIWLTLQVYWG